MANSTTNDKDFTYSDSDFILLLNKTTFGACATVSKSKCHNSLLSPLTTLATLNKEQLITINEFFFFAILHAGHE